MNCQNLGSAKNLAWWGLYNRMLFGCSKSARSVLRKHTSRGAEQQQLGGKARGACYFVPFRSLPGKKPYCSRCPS